MIQKIKNIKRQELKPGKIIIGIDRKVYFEYYLLEKPKREDFYSGKVFLIILWKMEIRDYEASKQLIEVVNEIENIDGEDIHIWFKFKMGSSLFGMTNNQKCKAEVTGDKATITELL